MAVAHDPLIALHAAACTVAFVAGSFAIAAPRRRWLFATYMWSLVGGMLALVAVVAIDWRTMDAGSRGLFVPFIALGAYLFWRAVQARHLLAATPWDRSPRYVDQIGFTLVALLDGFAVILALDLGAPGWAMAAVGVAVIAAGHRSVANLKGRLARGATDPTRSCADDRPRMRTALRRMDEPRGAP